MAQFMLHLPLVSIIVAVCVRTSVRANERACERAGVRACVCVHIGISAHVHLQYIDNTHIIVRYLLYLAIVHCSNKLCSM